MITELFTTTVLVGILASGFRLATPYLYASLGETFGQKSGVLNLGVEGIMLLGAFILLGLGAVLQWLQENGRRLNLWLFPGSDDPASETTQNSGSGKGDRTNPIFVEDIPGTVKPPDREDSNSDTQKMQPET